MMNEPIEVTMPVDRADLINLLKENTVFVTFDKRDGSERTMKCTLMDGVVVPHEKTTDRVKEPNPNVLPVWDIDSDAWRSFRLDTIKHVSYNVQTVTE
jgi:hypothetical protein